jgi:hypothetical protein
MKPGMALLLLALALPAVGGPLRDWLQQRTASHDALGEEEQPAVAALPPACASWLIWRMALMGASDWMSICPPAGHDRPLLVMVHGGAWRMGSKQAANVVDNKLAHWLPAGVVLVSLDYRLLPQAPVEEQADDVARAVAWVQAHAAEWGANKRQLVLMGHSAGAHLAGLLSTDARCASAMACSHGWPPCCWIVRRWMWRPSCAARISPCMTRLLAGCRALGRLSPTRLLSAATPPLLAVCSSRRAESCTQAQGWRTRAGRPGWWCRCCRRT